MLKICQNDHIELPISSVFVFIPTDSSLFFSVCCNVSLLHALISLTAVLQYFFSSIFICTAIVLLWLWLTSDSLYSSDSDSEDGRIVKFQSSIIFQITYGNFLFKFVLSNIYQFHCYICMFMWIFSLQFMLMLNICLYLVN